MMNNIRLTANLSLLILVLWFCSIGASADQYDKIDSRETIVDNMKLVYATSYTINPDIATTMQSILLQETGGGVSSLVGNPGAPKTQRSYGLMQLQVSAARSVLSRQPELCDEIFNDQQCNRKLSDDKIIHVLLTNPIANIKIATYHFQLYLSIVRGDWNRAVAGYNAGIGTALKMKNPGKFKYVQEISKKQTNLVDRFNEEHQVLTPDE